MNNTFQLRDALIGFLLLLLQFLIFQHLPILGGRPDLLLVYIIWITTRYSKVQTLIITFISSFILDAMLDLWGLHMFSNTLLVLAGYELIQNLSVRRLIYWQVFLLLSVIGLVKYSAFLALAGVANAYQVPSFTIGVLMAGTLYTALLGSLLDSLWKA